MKVQINRLLADSKCDGITYITGRCKWDFKHMQAQHCTNDTLHVLSMRLTVHHGHPSRDRDHMEETICTVRGYKTQPAVDPGCYLFLQPQPSMMPVPMSSTPPQVSSARAGDGCVLRPAHDLSSMCSLALAVPGGYCRTWMKPAV